MEVSTDIYASQTTYPNDFHDPLIFTVVEFNLWP